MAAHIFPHPPCTNFRRNQNKPIIHGAPHPPKSGSKHDGDGANGNGSAHSRDDLGCQPGNLTVRQQEVLEHLRLGESNKMIARRLGMTEGTVKVHIRQMMRKFHVSNRTKLALDGTLATESYSKVDINSLPARSVAQNGNTPATHRQQPPPLISPASRDRPRAAGKHCQCDLVLASDTQYWESAMPIPSMPIFRLRRGQKKLKHSQDRLDHAECFGLPRAP